jgi:hypothetical protein
MSAGSAAFKRRNARRLERARDSSTDALYNLNAANIDLLVATGKIMELVHE